ncbi:hypothetical protein CLOSTASPAR_03212 [[Clostridium] asparagiforme DSM 15981]|uniref:Uncharacterized protein n=1 Tax=[Clostridium] asparagiforme DSM 15981 TaxID=518636 RepID=C0D1S3_9FIRM|nr:hypothetical protein CLOSTASPAR_03212 [[Clostridium] asparagiforme DSM 15981]
MVAGSFEHGVYRSHFTGTAKPQRSATSAAFLWERVKMLPRANFPAV